MREMRFRRGFTLIEVALFLAVTGALFVGVTVGVQNSIFQQRYNDAVQNFAEFLRSVYAETMNVQSLGKGNTETAIYGKLITFGENCDLAGNSVNEQQCGSMAVGEKNSVFVYDVIGRVGNSKSSNVLQELVDLDANVAMIKDGEIQTVGIVEDYTPKWAAWIEQTGGNEIFKGAVLIARHPDTGTVYTYAMKGEVLNINARIMEATSGGGTKTLEERLEDIGTWFRGQLMTAGFTQNKVDFCINPNGGEIYRQRRDVRISANARNSSSVIVDATEGNPCIRN